VMVNIRSTAERSAWIKKREVCRVDLYAEIPTCEVVTASTVEGRIDVQRIIGNVVCKGVSADITLYNLDGIIRAQSVSGNIKASALMGHGDFDNVSGDVDIINSALSKLTCNTISGVIDFGGSLTGEGGLLSTISGNIILALSSDGNVSIGGKTLSGSVQLYPTTKIRKWEFGQFSADLNGGGTKLRITTVSGDIMTTLDSEKNHKLANQSAPAPIT
jgi:DUF4097 and DUF4098 domain-containing protein YvlB